MNSSNLKKAMETYAKGKKHKVTKAGAEDALATKGGKTASGKTAQASSGVVNLGDYQPGGAATKPKDEIDIGDGSRNIENLSKTSTSRKSWLAKLRQDRNGNVSFPYKMLSWPGKTLMMPVTSNPVFNAVGGHTVNSSAVKDKSTKANLKKKSAPVKFKGRMKSMKRMIDAL